MIGDFHYQCIVNKGLETIARRVNNGEESVRHVAAYLDLTVEDVADLLKPYGVVIHL
jgi:hypothetical protein